jgi:hypothetical protein
MDRHGRAGAVSWPGWPDEPPSQSHAQKTRLGEIRLTRRISRDHRALPALVEPPPSYRLLGESDHLVAGSPMTQQAGACSAFALLPSRLSSSPSSVIMSISSLLSLVHAQLAQFCHCTISFGLT